MARPGRPKGTPNRTYEHVATQPVRCTKCGSTRRDAYTQTLRQPIACTAPDGRPATAIVRRWTRCSDCGQARIERHYEYAPAATQDRPKTASLEGSSPAA